MTRTLLLSLAVSLVLAHPLRADDQHPDAAPMPESIHAEPAARSLVDVAAAAGNFQTLAAALQAAELVEALSGAGPFTVFAPTDEAFAAIPEILRDELLRPENVATLRSILTYHVVAGRVSASQALAAGSAETLQHAPVSFAIRDGRLRVQQAGVIANDIAADNGVIHVIDQVLLPPGVSLPQPQGRKVVGVYTERPSRALAAQLGIDRDASLLLSQIVGGGNAEAAGVQRYDVVTALNDVPASEEALQQVKEQAGFGGVVRMQLIRQGQPLVLDVTVGIERH